MRVDTNRGVDNFAIYVMGKTNATIGTAETRNVKVSLSITGNIIKRN